MQRLEAIHDVTVGGTTVTVDNRYLLSCMRSRRAVGEQSITSLRALVQALDNANESSRTVNATEARQKLDAVLARPEFSGGENSLVRALQDLRQRFLKWLQSLFPDLALPQIDFDKPADIAFWVVAGGLIIFTVVFLVFLWANTRRSMARYAALGGPGKAETEEARSARLAAQQAADSGDYRLAVHYLYLWAVLHLAERARLRYDRSLTNHEQVGALSPEQGDGEVARLLRSAVDVFDRIWYGHAPCTVAEYSALRSTVERIVEVTK
jgi:hypothetical protein